MALLSAINTFIYFYNLLLISNYIRWLSYSISISNYDYFIDTGSLSLALNVDMNAVLVNRCYVIAANVNGCYCYCLGLDMFIRIYVWIIYYIYVCVLNIMQTNTDDDILNNTLVLSIYWYIDVYINDNILNTNRQFIDSLYINKTSKINNQLRHWI